jgi:hypothetical protein
MSVFVWVARRSGGLAMLALLALCYWVLSNEAAEPHHIYEYLPDQQARLSIGSAVDRSRTDKLTKATFAYYCLLIHVLVFVFPLRACWAIWDLTKSLKKVRGKTLRELKLPRRGSSASLSSSETLASSSTSTAVASSHSSEAGDLEPDLYDAESSYIAHAIIIPNYKEELDTLRETLDVLASHPQACVAYDVSRIPSPPPFLVESATSKQELDGAPASGGVPPRNLQQHPAQWNF